MEIVIALLLPAFLVYVLLALLDVIEVVYGAIVDWFSGL